MDSPIPQKRCCKCEKFKDRIPENFGPDKRTLDGFRGICKPCRKIEREEAFTRNPDMHKQAYQRRLQKPIDEQVRLKTYNAEKVREYRRNIPDGICRSCCKRPSTSGHLCTECFTYHKEWNAKNLDRRNEMSRIEKEKLRTQVLDAYGSKCVCCGEMHPEFLAIDHIYGGGNAHRRSIGTGLSLYRWLRQQDFPKEGFQILCHNCNMAKTFYGCCPHQRIT